jgi:hypothetical protein
MSFASYEVAQEMQALWSNTGRGEPGYMARKRVVERLSEYFRGEYDRRVRRHAFYADLGFGGFEVMNTVQSVVARLNNRPYARQRR